MTEDLGEELPPQPAIVRSLLVIAAIGAAFALWLFPDTLETGSSGEALAATGIAVLVAVVLPLAGARFFRRLGYFVSDTAVTQTLGGRVWRRIELLELAEVQVSHAYGGRGMLGGPRRSPQIRLRGVDAEGRATGIILSGQLVRSMRPLLLRVHAEVSRRPELAGDPRQRELLQEFLDAS